MATTASPPTRTTHSARRTSPPTVSTAPQPAPSISRGATARSAASPRVSASLNGAAARRASLKGKTSPPPVLNGETRESLSVSLKLETEKKEKLLVQVQDKDQTIASLKVENDGLQSSLHAAETRLAELYADQGRVEEEMAARMEVTEKLRNQVRELEKEKRDLQKRYNEQTATFDAERQAFYDNEQHLKSRIQSLSQARRQPQVPASPSKHSTVDSDGEGEEWEITEPETPQQDMADPEQEPAEMTALKLELSTLSTSYASIQSTLLLLQSQLVDLKRVNNELQEENESYNILLREKTLSGQFDVLKMGGTSISEAAESSAGDEEEVEDDGKDAESFRSRATGKSTLDPVDELAEEHDSVISHGFRSQPSERDSQEVEETSQARNPRSRHGRKRSSVSAPRGESLANLPITGPGLDLAAELGRAENKDIFEGRTALDSDRSVLNPKSRKTKKGSVSESGRKVSGVSETGVETNTPTNDLDALRSEVKNLKDANKALSLYASKIIDRIISQEGFEHVLAVDYDKLPHPSTSTSSNAGHTSKSSTFASTSQKKARPQSAIFSSLTAPFASTTPPPPQPQPERLTTFDSPVPSNTSASPQSNASSPALPPSRRASRRSMSFDWKSFSMFGGGDKKMDLPPNLRPLTLKPGAPPIITSARKLDTQEDEEDRKERERLNATMKLMGIEKPPTTPILGTPVIKSLSTPVQPTATPELPTVTQTASTPVTATPAARFSFFRRSSSNVNSETSSLNSSPQPSANGANTPNLTQEVLEQAEAESALAALDAHERQLSAEIAKGASGGFTEITRRSGDRRSSRKSGSGGTVWSAGMSKEDD